MNIAWGLILKGKKVRKIDLLRKINGNNSKKLPERPKP